MFYAQAYVRKIAADAACGPRTALSFTLTLWMHMGVTGIALAMEIDWMVKAVLDVGRYQGGKWRSFRII